MKKYFLLYFSLCFSVVAFAQSTARKFVLNLTEDGQSTLTCFLPQNPSGRAVVDCPGGGYSHLAMNHEGYDWAEYFNKQGIAFFVLKYRMPHGEKELPISDACKAMRTVRDSASVWSINREDVGIMGFSAGGHLASTISTHADYAERPNFSILFYPVISMDPRKGHGGSSRNLLGEENLKDKKLVDAYSNEKAVRRHLTPRAIILLSNDDDVVYPVTNGVAYYSAMQRAGNECVMHIYPSGGHGWGFRDSWKHHDQMLGDLTAWLQGFKGPKENAIRVACIGNSITDGAGIETAEQRGYPARLQQKLGEGYQVKNFGVSARTLLNKGDMPYMKEMAWRDALAFDPNVVIIKLGTNDSKTHNWKYGNEFGKDMQEMIDSLKNLSSKPKIYLCSPIPAIKSSWTINDSVIVNGVIPVIQKVAKKNKCGFIDLHTQFSDPKLIQGDGIHPTAKGAEKMAEIISEALMSSEQETKASVAKSKAKGKNKKK